MVTKRERKTGREGERGIEKGRTNETGRGREDGIKNGRVTRKRKMVSCCRRKENRKPGEMNMWQRETVIYAIFVKKSKIDRKSVV